MRKTRAKFSLTALKNDDGSMSVHGHPVFSEDPEHENKQFSDSTPGGSVWLHIASGKEAQDNFEVGVTKEFYLDIVPVEKEPAAESNKEEVKSEEVVVDTKAETETLKSETPVKTEESTDVPVKADEPEVESKATDETL